MHRQLTTLFVVLNKADKAKDEDIKRYKYHVKRALDKRLTETCRSMNGRSPKILPCILVSNADGAKLADGMITQLAVDLLVS